MQTKSPKSKKFDPYFEWLDIAPAEQPADYYRLLGLKEFEQDIELIREQADERMSKVRQYQNSKHSRTSQRILNELSAAKSCLLNKKLRRLYDAKLSKILDKKKLPVLSVPVELLPEDDIPDGYDPFQGTADGDTEQDPLQPLKTWSIWPYLLALLWLLIVSVVIAFSLQIT